MLLEVIVLAISVLVGFGGWATAGADLAWQQTTGWLVFTLLGSGLLLLQAGWPILAKLRKSARRRPCRNRQSPRKRCQAARNMSKPPISRRTTCRRLKTMLHPAFGENKPWWVEKWLLKVALWLETIISPEIGHSNPAAPCRAPASARPVTPDGPGLRVRDRVARLHSPIVDCSTFG